MSSFHQLPEHARIWIYQSNRPFSQQEAERLNQLCQQFLADWTSHKKLMEAGIEILHERFIVIGVNEQTAPPSGCGIDKSLKFIEQLEKSFGFSLLNRMNVAYRKNGQIHHTTLHELKHCGADSVFDNLITTKGELLKNWEKNPTQSWHKDFLT